MGRLYDGTIVPTPRDRVVDNDTMTYYTNILKAEFEAFEIFYDDGSITRGPKHAWPIANADGVQIVVIKLQDGSIHLLDSLDYYLDKKGTWMNDEEYWNLHKQLETDSYLMKGAR